MSAASHPGPATSPPPDTGSRDPGDVAVVRRGRGLLRTFNEAGVLGPADVHVAATLGRICAETDEAVLLAAALAVRAPRLGHVYVDLAGVADTVVVDSDAPADPDALPWPRQGWVAAVGASALVASADGDGDRPLRLSGSRLYLDRYWAYEQQVLAHLRARVAAPDAPVDAGRLRAGLDRLFPADGQEPDLQRHAAATALRRRFTVVAGGPGTGKTTTVARVLALLAEQRGSGALPRVALAAPTGKAADRVERAVHDSVATLDVDRTVRGWLLSTTASTLHRLLGSRPGSDTRFLHDHDNPLPFDAVVVDEASMVALSMMAKLLDAVGPDTHLVLLGDPDQLASVEAGAVLGDIVGPLRTAGHGPPAAAGLPEAVVVLRRRHRFAADSGIAELAEAIQDGDGDAACDLLARGGDDLRWLPVAGDDAHREGAALTPVREALVAAAAPVFDAARAGDGARALAALDALRVLCAHRRGQLGVAAWGPASERWLARAGFDLTDPWYLGRPILITRTDYQMDLRNGDVGVVVAGDGGAPTVAFAGAGQVRTVSPVRLESYETVHTMTVHKSQGSQFTAVVVVLPEAHSPILTRELLYTAVTRAQSRVTVVGAADAVRAAVARPVQRASGLGGALWEGSARR